MLRRSLPRIKKHTFRFSCGFSTRILTGTCYSYSQARLASRTCNSSLQESCLFCGCSAFAIHRARSAPTGTQCCCSVRWGLLLFRFAERTFAAELFQLPPRITRFALLIQLLSFYVLLHIFLHSVFLIPFTRARLIAASTLSVRSAALSSEILPHSINADSSAIRAVTLLFDFCIK